MSGEGGAMTGELDVGPDMIPSATLCMSFSHLSQRLRFTAGFSVSGVEIDSISSLPPVLASLVLEGSVIVPLVFKSCFIVCVVLMDDDFLDTLGDGLRDDLRDTLGDEDFLRYGAERLETLDPRRSTGLSTGSNTISATLGDSVSLNAKSSVSVCLEALMISTHFSVQMPTSLNFDGSLGSSITLQSPDPTVFIIDIRSAWDMPQETLVLATSVGVI